MKRFLIPSLLLTGTIAATAQTREADIEAKTQGASSRTGTAKVFVRPAYLTDPDGGDPLGGNLVGRWDFEDNGAPFAGPYQNKGVGNSPLTTNMGSTTTVTGGVSRAVVMNGSSSMNATLTGSTAKAFTLSLWFKPDNAEPGYPGFQTLFRLDDYFAVGSMQAPLLIAWHPEIPGQSPKSYISIRSASAVDTAGSITSASVYTGVNTAPIVQSSSGASSLRINYQLNYELDDGKWHHLVVTYNGAAGSSTTGGPFSVYLDDIADGSGNPTKLSATGASFNYLSSNLGNAGSSSLNGKKVHFGYGPRQTAGGTAEYLFKGQYDRIRMYQGVLSNADIKALMRRDLDGDGSVDRQEVNDTTGGSNAFDPNLPSSSAGIDDNQGLASGTAGKGRLGRWDFESLTTVGTVKNLQRTDSNGDLMLGGASVPDDDGMPSKSARFNGRNVMSTSTDLIGWGGVKDYAAGLWIKADAGGTLATTRQGHILWALRGAHENKQLSLVLTQNPITLRENFDLICREGGGAGASILEWIPATRIGIADGGWYHVLLTRNDGYYALYVNGQAVPLATTGPAPDWEDDDLDGTGMRLDVGGGVDPITGQLGWQGRIDRLRFWNASLKDADAKNLYLQDYDGDSIPDITELGDGSLDPLVANTVSTAETAWDRTGVPVTSPVETSGLFAHWHFDSFRYGSSGRYFPNQTSLGTLDLIPNTGISVSNADALASNYGEFTETGIATAALGDRIKNKAFTISGWLKLGKGVIRDAPGVVVPFWELRKEVAGASAFDQIRLHASQNGANTQIILSNIDPADETMERATLWLLSRGVQLDNGGWHHVVLQQKAGVYTLHVDGEKLSTSAFPGYLPVNASHSGTATFRLGTVKVGAREFGFRGAWDRVRIYDTDIGDDRILALWNQDADGDGVVDRDEYGIIDRSPIVKEVGTVTTNPAGTDLSRIDLDGLPRALNETNDLLGFWDFESLVSRATGFPEWKARTSLIPTGAPADAGHDPGTGMPSMSAFVKGGGYLAGNGNFMLGKGAFTASFWIKTPSALLDRQPVGFSILSFEDLMNYPGTGPNTLTLRLHKTNGSQALSVQPYNTRTMAPTLSPGSVAWSLLNRRIDDGGWHHVVWARHASGSAIYVDGVLLTERVGTLATELTGAFAQTAGGTPGFLVGRISRRVPELAMEGNLDRLRLYGRGLTATEALALYQQDFDGDGFTDIYEMSASGFDPFKPSSLVPDDETTVGGDGDTGLNLASTSGDESTTLKSGLASSWNFETPANRQAGDGATSLRFSADAPNDASVANHAIADGGVQWADGGMISKSLGTSKDSYLSLPPAVLGASGNKLAVSFWMKTNRDEISGNALGMQAFPGTKVALLTLGANRTALPNLIVSVNHEGKIVAEKAFTPFPNDPLQKGWRETAFGKWHSPAKLDDGRWHHVVIDLEATTSRIFVDGFAADPDGTISGFINYSFGSDPYLWIGFRRNAVLDPANVATSQLPYTGWNGALDRVRLYTRNLTRSGTVDEVAALFAQDFDGDTIPDVTEANNPALDPNTVQTVSDSDDQDLDGLTKAQEDTLGTSWWKYDSDADWLPDGWEHRYTTGPDTFRPKVNDRAKRDLNHDTDTLTGWEEFLANSDPDSGDTDGDGASDSAEYQAGTDPTNPASVPGATPADSEMTRGGILPGGNFQANQAGADFSASYNGQDATGPRYRKISLNGRPLADDRPEAESETDQNPEETYVDAYSLTLRHDTSLIHVPVPASDLTLQVNLSLGEESWNNRSGILPTEKLTLPFGPCWTSNLCAYVQETTEVGGAVDSGTTPAPRITYSAIDEDGRGLRFGSYDGARIFAYPSAVSDRKSYQHQLSRADTDTLVLRKKFGTTLTYKRADLDQKHYSNRAGASGSYLHHRYYRLISVEDRYGNQIRYSYPNHNKTLLPTAIFVPSKPDLKIEVTIDPADPHRIKAVKDPRGYSHTFSYGGQGIPSGNLVGIPQLDALTGITDPLDQTVRYSYLPSFEIDPTQPSSHFALNVGSITDKRSVTTRFEYEADDDKFRSSFNGTNGPEYFRLYGLPRLVSRVTRAASYPHTMPGTAGIEQAATFGRKSGLRWIYSNTGVTVTSGGNQFIPVPEWSNLVTDAAGNLTTYTFKDIKAILADTATHGASFSLNWLIYYLQMDIIHPGGLGRENYRFDLASGLSLAQTTDICNNVTSYRYSNDGNQWGGGGLAPSNIQNLALFSNWSDPVSKTDALRRTETYRYSSSYRVMNHHADVFGTVRETAVDALGRRTGLTVTDKDGTLLSQESYEYGNGIFPAFMTRKTVVAFANQSGQTWEQNIVTNYVPDAIGRVASEVIDMPAPAADIVTSYSYNKNGLKLSTTDARGKTTSFGYDPLGRLTTTTYPPADGPGRDESRTRITLYDGNSNKHAEIDENGIPTFRLFDPLNRVSAEIRDMDAAGMPAFSPQGNNDGGTWHRLDTEGSKTAADLASYSLYNDADTLIRSIDPRGIVKAVTVDDLQRPTFVWENYADGDNQATFAASTEKRLTGFLYETDIDPDTNKPKNTGGSVFASDGFKPTKTTRYAAVLLADGSWGNIVTTATYDAVYRPLSEKTAYDTGKSVFNTTVYNDAARTVLRTQGVGETNSRATLVRMDGLGREIETTGDPGGLNAITRTFYSSTGLAWKAVDPLGRETESDFDGAGRPVKVWQPRSDLAPGAANFGKVDRTTGLGDAVIGSPYVVTELDGNGNATATIDHLGRRTDVTYDARNRKISMLAPAVDADGDPATPTTARPETVIFYDGTQNVTAQRTPRGNWTRSFFDRAYRLHFTRTNPDPTKIPATSADPEANGEFDIVTVNTLDPAGNILAVRDGNGNVTRNTWDALGRMTSTAVDPVDGDPAAPATGQEIIVQNQFDDTGNLILVTDGKGQQTAFRYDGLGRKTRTIWDFGKGSFERTEKFNFDGVALTQRIDPKNQQVNLIHDQLGRNTEVRYPTRTADDRVNAFDLAGNLLSVTYPNETAARKTARNVTQTFDALNRLLTETSNGRTHTSAYDKSGNLRSIAYQGGKTIASTYDALNRLATATEDTRVTQYGYDLDGNIVYKKLPNNVITRTEFDALGRRLKIRDLSGATELSVFDYSSPGGAGWFSGHDKAGNVVKVLEKYTRAELKNRTVINSYDKANRLNIETLDERPAGSLTVTTYTHDAANNRTAKVKVVNGDTVENLVYTFGDATAATNANTNQLTGYGPSGQPQTHTFAYDSNGNRITRTTAGRSDIYTWDHDNRLVALNYQTDSNATKRGEYRYAYDHRTRRVLRDESSLTGGANTSVTFSGGLSVQEFTGSTITRHYIRGSDWGGGIGGVLYSVDGSNAPLFDHYNSRGDVVGQTDASAAVTWQAAYEAYGTRLAEGGDGSATRQKANSKDEDPHGLLNEGFRYRDLETGVFITRDPMGFVDGPNVYTYVKQNPWSAFDPDGLEWFGIHTNREKGTDTFTFFGASFTLGGPGTNYNAGWLNGQSSPAPRSSFEKPMTVREFLADEAKQIPRDVKTVATNPGGTLKQLGNDMLQYPGNPTSVGNAVITKTAQNAPQLLTEGKIAVDHGKAVLGNLSARLLKQNSDESARIFTNFEARMWYETKVSKIDTSGAVTEKLARQVHEARNALKRTTRDMMADVQEAARLDKNFPIQGFDFYVKKYSREGLKGESLWKKIIDAGKRPNKEVTEKVTKKAGK